METSRPVTFENFEYSGSDPSSAVPLPGGHYRNPVLPGFYPDPSVCRVGDDFYLVNSTFAYFPGIPIFHSRDLVHWTQIGHVIDRATQLPYAGLEVSHGIFAPAISHHAGTFYVVCTMVDGGGNFLVTATDPAGPWSDPIWFGFEGIDPSLFFDYDGRAWIVNNGEPSYAPRYDGHRAIWIQEFDHANKQLIGPRRVLVDAGTDPERNPIWIEGPHLFKRAEWYYLMCAEGGTSEGHTEVIFRSRSPEGPFQPWEKNPILSQRELIVGREHAVTSSGHAELVALKDGSWWAFFLACRPYDNLSLLYATGRETFLLPVRWTEDGWPVILPLDHAVPIIVPLPQIAPAESPSREFNVKPSLPFHWVALRTPPTDFATQDPKTGTIKLMPRTDDLRGRGAPAFLARRVQHRDFTVTTSLPLPLPNDVTAGLAALQNELFHYFLGVHSTNSTVEILLECAAGRPAAQIAHATLPTASKLELRIECVRGRCAFAFRAPQDDWTTLASDLDASLLTTHIATGFVGAMVGPHARISAE